MNKIELYQSMQKSVIEGDKQAAVELAQEAIRSGYDLTEVIEKGFVPGIREVGLLWEKGDYFLPELITSAECMQAAMSVLHPHLQSGQAAPSNQGSVVIGTIEGDIHDIGKNLVASMLSANGFEVIDLGADIPIDRFIEEAEKAGAQFICLSALLTTTMLGQKKLIERLKEKGLAGKYIVMVGGAPVNSVWADDIGADGYAENAMTAVEVARKLAGERRPS